MIRATPTYVRWVTINDTQYRFQALQFHSNIMEVFMDQFDKRSSIASNDSSVSRKTSVVQIKPRDETSDYHSDDDVMNDDTTGSDDVFTTLCYVDSCSIKNKSRLSISSDKDELFEEEEMTKKNRRSHSLKDDPLEITKNLERRRRNSWHQGPPQRKLSKLLVNTPSLNHSIPE